VMESADKHQARLTFAMARHAAVDLSLVSQTPPLPPKIDRLTPIEYAQLRNRLGAGGMPIREGPAAENALIELRSLYEPFVSALAKYFEFAIPHFEPHKPPVDNWQTSAWTQRSPDLTRLTPDGDNEHFK
jgi:hypothetical protein